VSRCKRPTRNLSILVFRVAVSNTKMPIGLYFGFQNTHRFMDANSALLHKVTSKHNHTPVSMGVSSRSSSHQTML